MSDLSRKNKKSKRKNKKFRLVLVFVMLGYIAWVLSTQQIEINNRKKVLAQVDYEINKQQELKDDLAEKMKLVNTPEYIEKIAREKLGFARPDEVIFYDYTLKK